MLKKVILTSIISIILFFSISILTANADRGHIIKTVYFVPKDRVFQNHIPQKIANQIEKVQQVYAEQLEDHGYGKKTFDIQKDANNNVVIHRVDGRFNDAYYHNDTLNKVAQELKTKFPDVGKNIYIVSVDVSSGAIGENCGQARYGGGPAMIPTTGDCVKDDNRAINLIIHELSHALNLQHDFRDARYFLSWGGERDRFSECAAAYLAISPFFNDVHSHVNNAGQIKILTPETYPLNKKNWKLKFEVEDPDGIYQVKLEYSTPDQEAGIASCQCVSNKIKTTVEFEMPPNAINALSTTVWLHIIDKNANSSNKQFNLRGVERDQSFTYLTLEYDNPNSLTPTNPSKEWGWGWPGFINFFERKPNSEIPERPHQGFVIPLQIRFIHQWDHWFYLHAEGQLIYDLTQTEIDHRVFDARFYLPNPCGNRASVEIIAKADRKEIYKSGVIRWLQAQNKHITFDIPLDTKEFVIESKNGGDDIACDHFIIANAKLLPAKSEEPEEVKETVKEIKKEEPKSIEANSKLVLTWAKLKKEK